jgi:hypothetical protein
MREDPEPLPASCCMQVSCVCGEAARNARALLLVLLLFTTRTAVLYWLSVNGYQDSSFSTWPWLLWWVRWLMRQPVAAAAGGQQPYLNPSAHTACAGVVALC